MILRIKGADGNWYGIPAIKGNTGPQGPQGPQGKPGLGGERGLAFYRLNADLVGTVETYPFSSFAMPTDYVPRLNDLVLFNDGNLGYIYSVNIINGTADVAQVVDGTLKGADGYSPTVSVSKVDGVATISITDKNGTKTVKLYDGASGGGTGGNGVSDWEQNDPNGAGYIKNRTHYKEETPSGVVIDTTTVYYPDNGHSVTIDVPAGIFFAGVRYTVSWFNNPYELVCYENNDGDPTLGNGYLSDSSLPDTGEPFCLVNPQGGSSLIVYRKLANQPNNILKVESEGKTIYHQLDPRYMKDMYYEEEVSGLVEILPETAYEAPAENPMFPIMIDLGLVAGNTYTVKWNGVEYTCVGQTFEDEGGLSGVVIGNMSAVGSEDTGEPFLIVEVPPEVVAENGFEGMGFALDGTTSGTYSILGEGTKTVVHPIDPKFIKDMYWKEENGLITLVSATGLVLATANTYRMQGRYDLVIGNEYIVYWRGKNYTCIAVDMSAMSSGAVGLGDIYTATDGQFGTEPTGEPFAMYKFPDGNVDNGLTYINPLDGLTSNLDIAIYERGTVYHKIPEEYMPDSVVAKEINIGEYNSYFILDRSVNFSVPDVVEDAIAEQTGRGNLKFTGVDIKDSEDNIILSNLTIIFGMYSISHHNNNADAELRYATAMVRAGEAISSSRSLYVFDVVSIRNVGSGWQTYGIVRRTDFPVTKEETTT